METDSKNVLDTGELQVIDNQVDQTTGTIRLKADFPNKDLQLWPGQFVNVRLLLDTLVQVVVVPTSSIQRGPEGTFVYIVGSDSKAAVRPVAVGPAGRDDRRRHERPQGVGADRDHRLRPPQGRRRRDRQHASAGARRLGHR
ncbi:MAG: hypothetical protein WDN31_06980 [Hyphomicrobium sp.]